MRSCIYIYHMSLQNAHSHRDQRRWQANTNNRYEPIARWQTLCICLPSSGWRAHRALTTQTSCVPPKIYDFDAHKQSLRINHLHAPLTLFGRIVIRTCRPGLERAENSHHHFRCEAAWHPSTRPIWSNRSFSVSREHTTKSSIWQYLKSSKLKNFVRTKGYALVGDCESFASMIWSLMFDLLCTVAQGASWNYMNVDIFFVLISFCLTHILRERRIMREFDASSCYFCRSVARTVEIIDFNEAPNIQIHHAETSSRTVVMDGNESKCKWFRCWPRRALISVQRNGDRHLRSVKSSRLSNTSFRA